MLGINNCDIDFWGVWGRGPEGGAGG